MVGKAGNITAATGGTMLEEKLNKKEPKEGEKQKFELEIRGIYDVVDCILVIEILTLTLLHWLKRLERLPTNKRQHFEATVADLDTIHACARAIKKRIRLCVLEVLGGHKIDMAKKRHSALWKHIKYLLKRMQLFK